MSRLLVARQFAGRSISLVVGAKRIPAGFPLPRLPQIVADARSVKQIALNVLSNSIALERSRRHGITRSSPRKRDPVLPFELI